MSAITFTLNFTGTPDADDQLAARHIVALENKSRAEKNAVTVLENERLALLTPPGTPIPLLAILPTATGAELKASYLGLFLVTVTSAHLSYIEQAKTHSGLSARITEDQMKQIMANLSARLNAGATPADLITDTAS